MVKIGKVMVTGLKVIVLNIIAGILIWIMAFFVGLAGGLVAIKAGEMGAIITGIVLFIIIIIFILYLNGIVARKLWKWK